VHERPARLPRTVAIVLRPVVSALVVGFLLFRTDIGRLAASIDRVGPSFLVSAFLAFLGGIIVNAYRWRVFLQGLGVQTTSRTVLRLTFVGTFFNAFLPTGFGGDAYKAIRLRSASAPASALLATAFLDRLAGMVGLAFLGLAGFVADQAARGSAVALVALGLSFLVLVGSALALTFARRWQRPRSSASRTGTRIRSFLAAFAVAGRHPRSIWRGIEVGIASAVVLVGVHELLAKALAIPVPLAALPGIVLIASVATALPVTLNGLGVREAAYVWALTSYGTGRADAVAFALLVLVVNLCASAVGGLIYAAAGGRVRSPQDSS
jgi:uncharacterized protein (TIRG00374 family)